MLDAFFLNANASAFEDFWNRRVPEAEYELHSTAYGYDIHFLTNDPQVLDAARISAARYCRAKTLDGAPNIQFRVLVHPAFPDTPVPADLLGQLQTVGVGDVLYQAATPWVQWVTDLNARTCTMLISRTFAADPWQLTRSMLDRAVLNILVREGVGQLHATTLVREDTALLFVAPHGTGKSTTAFHLLHSGFQFMGDGLLFVRETRREGVESVNNFELMGYPVGEAKLTDEAKAFFPEWRGEGTEVTAHSVVKHVVNLRELAPGKMIETSVVPKRVVICLAERNGAATTTAHVLTPDAAFQRLLPDTIFWDAPEAMARSLGLLRRLLDYATCYRLNLGTDRQQLVETVLGLVG